MKNKALIFLVLIISVITGFLYSCQHVHLETCGELDFHISTTKTDAIQNNANGTITATATGGTGFRYSLNGGPLQDTGYFAGLEPFQTYRVVGYNSIGCTDTAMVSIGSINPCQGVNITITATKTDASANQSNGSINATASGGAGFTYSINGGPFQASGLFSNLAAGTYTIAAQSDAGCLGTTQVTIGTVNPCAGVTINITTTQVNPTTGASNGSITATASGSAGFTYSINGGTYQSSGTFVNLAAGTYTITAKNANGCTGTKQVTLTATNPCAGVTVTVTTATVNPTTGQSNGSITATATGGSGFTYSLNGGAFQSSGTFSNLATGNYTVTAKNSNGCTGVTTISLGSTNPCAGVTITVTTTQVNPVLGQSNGSITASATGGTGFTYSINNGTFQTAATFSNLAAGTYTITAKNSNGCIGTKQVILTATDPCAGITVTVTTTQVNPTTGASNGSITASATGGTGFTYSINGGAFQSGGTFSNLSAGTYTITAKNANGCTGTKQVTLVASNPCTNVNIVITANVINTTPCQTATNNGSITVTATGSTGLTYNISGGAYQASGTFANLNAGTYLVGVKDANGCTKTQSVTVGVVPRGPLFTQVRAIITAKCGNCHLNGGNTAGYNFDSDCSIVSKWSQINKACVTYQMVQMPPSQQLPTSEKTSITNWVNAGHRYTD